MRNIQIFTNVGGDDSAYFSRWCESLRADGWPVEIVSAISGADYRGARTRWQRFVLRWRMYVGFAGHIAWACLTRRDALRIVTTNPFFAPWLAALLSGRDSRVLMLLYDLYPDALEVGRPQSRSGLMHRIIGSITRSSIRRCHAVVFLGERLRRHAETRYGAARKGVVIPVGADCDIFGDAPPAFAGREREIEILYCGQMGFMHELDTLTDLFAGHADVAWTTPPGLRFRFHSSGRTYAELQQRCSRVNAPGWPINWEGPLVQADWAPAMKRADIGLVTLRRGAERVAMPSKVYSAMAAGQAILAIAPLDSDLADLVRCHDCGWVIEPGDLDGLRTALREVVTDPEGLRRKRVQAFEAARRYYGMQTIGRAWTALLRELEE